MTTQVTTGKHGTRRIGESTGLGISSHYIMATLPGVIVRAKDA